VQKLKLFCMGYGFSEKRKDVPAGEAIVSAVPPDAVVVSAVLPEDLETLAQMEHLRWMVEKYADGIVFGKNKDQKQRETLVPWTKLPPGEKEKDKSPVKRAFQAAGNVAWRRQKLPPTS
jgi:hypothetical protein